MAYYHRPPLPACPISVAVVQWNRPQFILNFLRTTKTAAGLVVNATLLDGDYPTGIKVSQAQMNRVNMRQHKVLPMWNYTLVSTWAENVS